MKILSWTDSKIKNFRWYDISLIKLSTVALVLALVKFFPVILSLDWKVYFVVGLLAMIRPWYVMLKK